MIPLSDRGQSIPREEVVRFASLAKLSDVIAETIHNDFSAKVPHLRKGELTRMLRYPRIRAASVSVGF